MINPHIKCSVKNCKFNDAAKHCSLDTITVGNTTPDPHACKDTECDSFAEC
ncbi:MAG: DUF1540 domain-containing protein [Defluviitaleaceae bacterium]|nr:DUF1540 domain-containing protein [Defluviitaleaceae bacterium]